MRRILIASMLLLLLIACVQKPIENTGNNPDSSLETGSIDLTATDELKKFESKSEIIEYLKQNQASGNNNFFGYRRGGVMALAESAAMDVKTMGSSPASAPTPSADDYSTTNIQVKGVDEADFIKNDGKYIYMVANNKLVIVKAFPADQTEIVSETNIKGYPTELFLSGDQVIVFANYNDEVMGFNEYDAIPRPMYEQKTRAIVFDVSDREDPEVKYDFDIKGNYVTSRMIGDYIYFVAQDPVYYYGPFIDTPVLRESGKVMIRPPVYYFDNPDENFNFNTIMSLNLKTGESKAASFMMGYASTIYVSEDNIYVTYQRNMPWRYYEVSTKNRFNDAVVPLLPSDVKDKVEDIYSGEGTDAEKWDEVSGILEEMYNTMDEDEKEEFIQDMQEAMTEYDVKQEEKRQQTIIHKINIKDGNIEYDKKGEVKGYLLNQFSMDESDGNFRVTTTFSAWANGENIQYNNVYVLDEDMQITGRLEKLAPEEKIYSARFMGDRLYLVTFRQVDPFFVIDLSDETDPKVLGKLKLPGYSDYLHPYDEDLIIGFGKETGESEWGGITTKGLKLALFDVSDFENPKLVDKYVFGDQGSDSEALRDHKAFLFSKDKNLLVLPATVMSKQSFDSKMGYYRQDVWQGAYVFTVTEEGFELKGKVRHSEGNNYNYWGSAVRRSLFMDRVLYTVSNEKILLNSLSDLEKLGEIELPTEVYYPEQYYKGAVPVATPDVGSAEVGIGVEQIVIE